MEQVGEPDDSFIEGETHTETQNPPFIYTVLYYLEAIFMNFYSRTVVTTLVILSSILFKKR